MNSKRIVQRIALSALMVSALAGSAVASAAADTIAPDSAPTATAAPTAAAAPAVLAVTLQDPLTLAKQYAPDTAAAWESLLAKYNSSFHATLKPATVSIRLADAEDGRDPAVRELRIAEAVPVEGGIPVVGGESGAVEIVTVTALANVETGSGEFVVADRAGTVTLTAAAAPGPFVQGQIELAEAARSQDANAIRDALAKLYSLYEARIEKLQELK